MRAESWDNTGAIWDEHGRHLKQPQALDMTLSRAPFEALKFTMGASC
jgi:hypothetical protein